jgi:ribosomal protein S18 acetylase RimI-like enzyme
MKHMLDVFPSHLPEVEVVATMNRDIYDAFCRLIPALSSTAKMPSYEALEALIVCPTTHLFLAREPDRKKIIGSLTLVLFRVPTGVRAWIEDVVVDVEFRGAGVGKALCQSAIELATEAGAQTVDLTSHPSKEAANRLYKSFGFAIRDTNVYRYEVE